MRRTRLVPVAVLAVALLGACGSDDAAPATTTTTSTTAPPAEPLSILVTNDDGIGAPGIDALVTALADVPDVEVDIVAPAENQSGTSDKTTPGGAPYADGETASGVPGTAVNGFPADTIAVALDELGLEPDLVVSGINEGQNVGPLAYVSGTVGAGRAAVRRGIPAIAGSAGFGEDADYAAAAALVVDQIEAQRADVEAGEADVTVVVNINVPDCTAGDMQALVEVPLATVVPEGVNPFESDCSITAAGTPADDVAALVAGHAALSLVPPEAPAP